MLQKQTFESINKAFSSVHGKYVCKLMSEMLKHSCKHRTKCQVSYWHIENRE